MPWRNAEAAFHREHARLYGFANPDRRIEVVTIRVRARAVTQKPTFPKFRATPAASLARRIHIGGRWRQIPVMPRSAPLLAKSTLGPLLITDYGSTTLVPPAWRAILDRVGNLVLTPA